MKQGLLRLVALALMVLTVTVSLAYAQGATTNTISGVVVDSSGGVIPGADVVVKHIARARPTLRSPTRRAGSRSLVSRSGPTR